MFERYYEMLLNKPIIQNELKHILLAKQKAVIDSIKDARSLNKSKKLKYYFLKYIDIENSVFDYLSSSASDNLESIVLKVKHKNDHNHIFSVAIDLEAKKITSFLMNKDIVITGSGVNKVKTLQFSGDSMYFFTVNPIKNSDNASISQRVIYKKGQPKLLRKSDTLNNIINACQESDSIDIINSILTNKKSKPIDFDMLKLRYDITIKKIPNMYNIDLEELIEKETFQ